MQVLGGQHQQFRFSSMQPSKVFRSVGWGEKDKVKRVKEGQRGPPVRIRGPEAPSNCYYAPVLILLLRTCAKRKGLTGRLAAHGEAAELSSWLRLRSAVALNTRHSQQWLSTPASGKLPLSTVDLHTLNTCLSQHSTVALNAGNSQQWLSTGGGGRTSAVIDSDRGLTLLTWLTRGGTGHHL